ncbi:MAG: hypothetical protein JNL38_25090 [Myxococcales bacterium]|jgi:hypothetical protein|nr:hypothetical protein [Myxococcales bacterium]
MMLRRLFVGSLVLAAGIAALGGSTSCASAPDNQRITIVVAPNYDIYKAQIDTFLNKRCGTLDCHGQQGRALRLYGYRGFRLYNVDAGLISGVQQTTESEIRANFDAIISLEPEEMSRVIAEAGENPDRLLFLRKAQNIERHKGGPSLASDDDGYKCITAWLRADPRGGTLSPAALASCEKAAKLP